MVQNRQERQQDDIDTLRQLWNRQESQQDDIDTLRQLWTFSASVHCCHMGPTHALRHLPHSAVSPSRRCSEDQGFEL